MGLGGQKKRTKLAQDPNNTSWSKSTDNFGHKILSAQGWTPGSFLGAENANHASHYTAANASHIRVLLREDNLGIGAKIGTQNAETFGLSMFSGLLGRLNGKSDVELHKQETAQRDVQLRAYQAQKHGYMNFVSGGLLVGDKMEELESTKMPTSVEAAVGPSIEGRRKRKAGSDEDAPVGKALKTKKRKSDLSAAAVPDEADSSSDSSESEVETSKETAKAEKKKSKKKAETADETTSESALNVLRKESTKRKKSSTVDPAADEKARLKTEKRVRKEERRKRKEDRRRRREAKGSSKSAGVAAVVPEGSSAGEDEIETIAVETEEPKPTVRPQPAARHNVRHRYIQQKRLASMNPQALKEIFMIKATS